MVRRSVWNSLARRGCKLCISPIILTSGVPERLNLDPTLYFMFINDLGSKYIVILLFSQMTLKFIVKLSPCMLINRFIMTLTDPKTYNVNDIHLNVEEYYSL